MSDAEPIKPTALIIGGETAVGCEWLSALVTSYLRIDRARRSNFLCHPGLWASPRESENLKDHVSRFIFPPFPPDANRLPWCVPDLPTLTGSLLSDTSIREMLINSSDLREFIDRLIEPKMAIKNTHYWIDHTPENIYTMEAILDAFPLSRGINIVRDGRAAVFDRIKKKFSPKGAARIWVVATAIGQHLQTKHSDTGRMLTVRMEDLLEQPKAVFAKVIEHFQLSTVAGSDFDSVDWLSSETSPLESALLDRIDKLRGSLAAWQTGLPENFEQYLYGTNSDVQQLDRKGINAMAASGAELLNQLGYPAIRHELTAVKLSKSEQSLKHKRSKFVNPLAQYHSPQADIQTEPGSHSSHLDRHPLHSPFCLKCWYRKFKHYSSPSSNPLDNKDENTSSHPAPNNIPEPASIDQQKGTPHEPPPALSSSSIDLAVVIAFNGRHKILELVVEELAQAAAGDLKLKAILAYSTEKDENFVTKLKEKHHFVSARLHPNQPLGAKWQAGVEEARRFNPRYLMILGSDDIMSPRLLTNALQLMDSKDGEPGFDFVAPSCWHLYDCESNSSYLGSLWELTYQNRQPVPLGAGRIYSAEILNRFDWRLFHCHLRIGLDSRGFQQVLAHHGNVYRLPKSMGTVLSIKGNWSNLNSTDKILNAVTIKSRPVDFSKKDFFSENFSFTEKELLEWFQGI